MEEDIGGNRFFVKGTPQEVAAHERIVRLHIKASTARVIASYGVSAVFAIVAAILVMFAPESRTTAATIFAIAFALLAAGIAGFTRLSAKVSDVEFKADKQS